MFFNYIYSDGLDVSLDMFVVIGELVGSLHMGALCGRVFQCMIYVGFKVNVSRGVCIRGYSVIHPCIVVSASFEMSLWDCT